MVHESQDQTPRNRTGRRGPLAVIQRDWESARRLAAVFAEEDAEISARIGEDITVEYRFKCRQCGARFSLQQQLDAHEAACGRSQPDAEESMAGNGQRPITCKHCGHVSPSLTSHSTHLYEAHREATLARRRELAARRRAESAPPDGGRETPRAGAAEPPVGGETGGSAAPAAVPPANERTASPAPRMDPQRRCPLCDGPLPAATAQLVAALQAEGLAEAQAFAAVRVARRVLCPAGTVSS